MNTPQKIPYLAIGTKNEETAATSPGATDRYHELKRWIGSASATGEAARLSRFSGCLNRLRVFLLQACRLKDYAEGLRDMDLGLQDLVTSTDPDAELEKINQRIQDQLASNPEAGLRNILASLPIPGSSVAVHEFVACADFESLLFHALAALDRLSECVAEELGIRQANPVFYNHLYKRVENNVSDSDGRKQLILHHMDEAAPLLEGILTIAPNEDTSLRTHLIHYASHAESTLQAFTIARLPDGRRIIFDCVTLDHAVLATARLLCQVIPFLVINLVSGCLDVGDSMGLDCFEPEWTNPAIDLRDFEAEGEDAISLPVARLQPGGFGMRLVSVGKAVLEHAI